MHPKAERKPRLRFRVLLLIMMGLWRGRAPWPPGTLAALQRVRASGRKLVLVTGRELPELLDLFSSMDLFDLVVAENGALLHFPATRRKSVVGSKSRLVVRQAHGTSRSARVCGAQRGGYRPAL